MVSNPIQRKQRNSLLAGLFIGLVIGLVLCGVLFMFLKSNNSTIGTSKNELTTVAVLNKSVKSGTKITMADVTTMKVNKANAPTDPVTPSDNSVAKIDLTQGTIISQSMLTTEDSKLTNNLREQEYNMITLPTQLTAGDFIDVRIQMPDGADYIVVSKKSVKRADASTVWLNMSEEEILSMSNAIVEYYIMAGSKLYATKYTDPGAQEASTPTYCPNATVVALINSQLNGNIKALTEGRYTENLKAIRKNRIDAQLSRYEENGLENLESSIKDEIENLKQTRQAYFGALNSAQ